MKTRSASLFTIFLIYYFSVIDISSAQKQSKNIRTIPTVVTPKSCGYGKALISLSTKEMGATLWLDGIRLGFIPYTPFCLSGGLHFFSLQRPKRQTSKAKRAGLLLWTPNRGRVSIDLSGLRLIPVAESLQINERVFGPSLEKDQLHNQVHIGQLELVSELMGYRDRLPNHQTQLHIDDLVSMQQLKYKTADTSSLYRLGINLMSFKDLWTPTSVIHPHVPWHSSRGSLHIREANLALQFQQKGLVDIHIGRQYVQLGGRVLLGDGLLAMRDFDWGRTHSWHFKPSVNLVIDQSNYVRQSTIKDETWVMVDAMLKRDLKDGGLSVNLSTLHVIDESEGEVLHHIGGVWTQHKSKWKADFDFTETGRVSLAQTNLRLNGLSGRTRLYGAATYRAGDRWDQRWLAGDRWPLVFTQASLNAEGAVTWYKLTLGTAYIKGHPPSWRDSDQSLSSLEGTSMLALLRWGNLGSSFIKALNHHQDKASIMWTQPLSWGVEYAYLTLDDTSQYWGFSPHHIVMTPSPSSLSIFTIGGAQHIKFARHDLALSVVLSTDIKELMYWPEVKLTWRYESLSLSTLCGKPVSLPHLLAPNYWFSYCGAQLKIKSQIEI